MESIDIERKREMEGYLLALDAGGTMTDTFLMDGEGNFVVGKALTDREDESRSYLESVEDAAVFRGISLQECHQRALSSIYAGTGMLNLLLTRGGRKVGILTTRGNEHIGWIERGLTWLELPAEDVMHQVLHEHPPALVEPRLIKGATERIGGGSYYGKSHLPPGEVLVPLREEDVRAAVRELLAEGVEVIGILFLYSYLNPAHEQRAAELAREEIRKAGREIPVILSYDVSPVIKENQRFKSLLLECYAAEPTRKQLERVESAARAQGYPYSLMTLLSYGGVVSIRHPRLYETVISGPIGGLMGGKAIAELIGRQNLICCDMGGTSFDVGLIVQGKIGIHKEPDFAGHRLALPMVSIDSIGAGAGMAIHLDEQFQRITLGPESAGAEVGLCYQYPLPTVSDINLILGYLNEEYFLGGKVKLDKPRALEGVEKRLARPLGMDVYQLGNQILELLHSQMKDVIYAKLLSRGYNPAEYALLVYGGSGPMHLWGISEGLGFGEVLTLPWAAAFSAFGIAASEYLHRYHKGVVCLYDPAMDAPTKLEASRPLNQGWRELEEKARADFGEEGISPERVAFRYGVYARYLGQIESFEVPLSLGRVERPEEMDRVIAEFEAAYAAVYPKAARYPQSGYFISEVFLEAVAERTRPHIPRYPLSSPSPKEGYKGRRRVYHAGRWETFELWEMDRLAAGNEIQGPAIVEHPMTTLVVPPGRRAAFDEHRLIWYR